MLAAVHVYVLVHEQCIAGVIVVMITSVYSVPVETTLDYTITCVHM